MEQYRHRTIYIYDIDDDVLEEQNGFPISMMTRSHCVLVPNEFLANQVNTHQPHCHIIRTHIDLATVEKTPKAHFDPISFILGGFHLTRKGLTSSMLSKQSYCKNGQEKFLFMLM